MDKTTGARTVSALAALTMLAGSGTAAVLPAMASTGNAQAAINASAISGTGAQSYSVKVANVQGSFAFTQDKLSSNEAIAGVFTPATMSLCGSPADSVIGRRPLPIAVGGDVKNAFTASSEDLTKDVATTVLMTCACAANIAGGGAIINAKVSGVSMQRVAAAAGI